MKTPGPFQARAEVTNRTRGTKPCAVQLTALSSEAARFTSSAAWSVGDAVALSFDAGWVDRDFGEITAEAEVVAVDEAGVLLRLEDLGEFLKNGIDYELEQRWSQG